MSETKKRRILIIGLKFPWQLTKILEGVLRQDEMNEVTYINDSSFTLDTDYYRYRLPYNYECLDEYDYIFIGQTEINFNILTSNKAPVIYLHTEFLWYPGCQNPNYILTVHPQSIDILMRDHPQHLQFKKDHLWIGFFFDEKKRNNVKILTRRFGIHYMGLTCTEDHSHHGIKNIYNLRAQIVGSLQGKRKLSVHPSNYSKKYLTIMRKWDAALVVDGDGTYFSPRAIDYASFGVIPIIWVGADMQIIQYYKQMGFKDRINCIFAFDESDIDFFYKLSDPQKNILRESAIKLSKRFAGSKVVQEIFDWVKVVQDMKTDEDFIIGTPEDVKKQKEFMEWSKESWEQLDKGKEISKPCPLLSNEEKEIRDFQKQKKGWTPFGYPKTGYVVTNDFNQKKTYNNPKGKEVKKDE